MTFDEKLVEDKIKGTVNDILFNKIKDYNAVKEDKSKLWAIVKTTDLMELLEHDDCPKSNLISTIRLSIAEIEKPNTNWAVINKLSEMVK